MATENGKVKWFNEKKGFGFIIPDLGGSDVFVHITGVLNGKPLNEGQRVSFELMQERGKTTAKNVRAA